jgi:hypothetical protein
MLVLIERLEGGLEVARGDVNEEVAKLLPACFSRGEETPLME